MPAQERQLEMLVNVDRCLSKLPMVEGSSGESVLLAIYLFLYFFSLSWLTVLGAEEKVLPNERLSACWLCWITGYFYLLEALLEKVTAPVAGWIGFQVGWDRCSSPKGHSQIMNCWPWREWPNELTCCGCLSLLVVGLARAGVKKYYATCSKIGSQPTPIPLELRWFVPVEDLPGVPQTSSNCLLQL